MQPYKDLTSSRLIYLLQDNPVILENKMILPFCSFTLNNSPFMYFIYVLLFHLGLSSSKGEEGLCDILCPGHRGSGLGP